jgi:hypothetical protein
VGAGAGGLIGYGIGSIVMAAQNAGSGGLHDSIEQEIQSSQNTGGNLVGGIGRPQAVANPDPELGPNQVRYQVRFADEFGQITGYSVNYDPVMGRFGTIKPSSGR